MSNEQVERLIAKLDTLIEVMIKNERDRELSPYWRRGDGRPMTRRECEAGGMSFEGSPRVGLEYEGYATLR